MTYAAIAEQCALYSREKGFEPTTMDTCAIRLMGISREISELRDAIKSGNRADMSLESADVACYAVLVMHNLGCTSWSARGRMHCGPAVACSPADMVDPLRRYNDLAFEAWRRGLRTEVILCLELLLAQLVDIRMRCLHLPNELAFDMALKLAYNRGRGALHGGKDRRS